MHRPSFLRFWAPVEPSTEAIRHPEQPKHLHAASVDHALVPQHSQAKSGPHLRMGRCAHGLSWIALFLLHAANLAYYAGVAWLYVQFDFSNLEYQLELASVGIESTEYRKVSAIHACVAGIHGILMLLMVGSSIHARRLAFHPDLRRLYQKLAVNPVFTRLSCLRLSSEISGRTASFLSSTRLESFGRAGSFIFARDGLLGVESVYFDHVLLARELVETSLQTLQLYRMTQVLPRLWLIRFYLALLVGNCLVVPWLHRYYRDREALRRLLCLLVDAVLDMVSSIGVSVVIFATYAPQYNDPAGFGFPRNFWFDDEWFANMQQEFRIMLVASWGDMGSRLVFALGLVQCMDAIKDILTPRALLQPSPSQHKRVITPAEPGVTVGPQATMISQASSRPQVKIPTPTKRGAVTKPFIHAVSFVVHVVGPALFVVWGCVLLAVHLSAESKHNDSACSLHLKPWHSTKPGCSLVEISCASIQSNGNDKVIDLAWNAFDPDRAAGIVVRHCPELSIPRVIQSYRHITTLKIYNSTIVDWSEAAALTTEYHSALRAIYIVRTFTPSGKLPLGLQSADFPKRLASFITCVTNLDTLPDDLDAKWPKGMLLTLDFSALKTVPEVYTRLQPTLASFAGTTVSVVPTEILENPLLLNFQASLSQLQELPRHVNSINPVLRGMFLQYTNVTTFWSWIDHYAHYVLNFPARIFNGYGTPYCRELLEIVNGTRKAFSVPYEPDHSILMDVSTPEKLAFAMQSIDCTSPGPLVYFPLLVEDAKHAWKPVEG